jgi:hypothetical protein
VGLTSIFIALLCAGIQDKPPAADHIRVIQEAQQREHSRAIRAIPKPRRGLTTARPASTLSEEERAELRRAVERFVRKGIGEVVDLRKVQP